MNECKYGLEFLKKKGWIIEPISQHEEGITIYVDKEGRILYIENVTTLNEFKEIVQKIKKEYPRVSYFWACSEKELYISDRRKYWKGKLYGQQLKSLEDLLEKSRHIKDVLEKRLLVDKFFVELLQMMQEFIIKAEISPELSEPEKYLLFLQNLNRIIFLYFINDRNIITSSDGRPINIMAVMKSRKDLWEFLKCLFFNYFNKKDAGLLEVDGIKVKIPFLDGGLFRELEFNDAKESQISISRYDWNSIFTVLDSYNWKIEEEELGTLTPEVLGEIYEKLVIGLDSLKSKGKRLVKLSKKELLQFNKKYGAYYTPEEITNYISRNTIYPYIQDRIYEKFKIKYKNIQEELLNKKEFTKKEIEVIKYLYFEILTKIRICDNACGSGSFLLAAGDILFRLRKNILWILKKNLFSDPDIKEELNRMKECPSPAYYFVREIIVNNLYGVDIMEGAVEIAKLRFWLWLISQLDPKKLEGKRIETLPNLDFNLMVGNSLIGFIDIKDIVKGFTIFDFSKNPLEWLKSLAKKKQEFKTLPAHEAIKVKEKLNKELNKARKFLNEKFYNMLKAKGIKISKKEFRELKPFHWGFEFYEVFDLEKPKEERGFDIIIGNPPYGQDKLSKIEREILTTAYNFDSLISEDKIKGSYNISCSFIERSFYLINKFARFGYIVNNSIARVDEFGKIRRFLLKKTNLYEIIDVANPFKESGVTLEMIIIFFRKNGEQKFVLVKSKRVPNYCKKIPTSIFERYNRFILYFDEIFDFIFKTSKIGVLRGTRGRDIEKRKRSVSGFTLPYLFSGKSVKKYFIDNHYVEFANKEVLKTNSWLKEYNSEILVTTKISDRYRASLKPRGFIVGNNVIKLKFIKEDLSPKYLITILNSHLMDYITKKYILNFSELTIAFYDSVTMFTPIKTLPNQQPFILLCEYMLFLHATEERRTKEKEFIDFIDKQIIDSLVYELYFKEKFYEDKLYPEPKEYLLELVSKHLKSINYDRWSEIYYKKMLEGKISSKEEEELKELEKKNLEIIKEVVEKIKNDKKIMEQMEKIKSHPWVRVIEGRENESKNI